MDELELLDWKRRVFELYAEVRARPRPRGGVAALARDARRALPHAPAVAAPGRARAGSRAPVLRLRPGAARARRRRAGRARAREIATSGERARTRSRASRARASRSRASEQSLDLYWLDGYGGGSSCRFADATSGSETYGAGRYLLDTVKGSDLGERDGRLVLDFNFAYNPSCSYDPRWVCPLAPPGNRLAAPVRGGERYPITG